MVSEPVSHVGSAATALRYAGATLVACHSAHVFHGVQGPVLYDLGDFIDDDAIDPRLRNDLGLLFLITFDGARPVLIEGMPLALDCCYTRLANRDETSWIVHRFREACAEFGTEMGEQASLVVIVC
jgi:poly-gamma-glutamate synthesis protein (capsule biosynthesis protein)